MAEPRNYTLGMAKLTFWEDTSAAGDGSSMKKWEIGNIVNCSLAPEVTTLDHFTVNNGTRKKDRTLITQKTLAINFTFDEITAGALKEFLLASAAGTASASGYHVYPMVKGEIKGCAKLTFDTEFGRNWEWSVPCAAFKPDGTFDFNAEDWMNAKGIIDVLVDESSSGSAMPYGTITFTESSTTENFES